MLIERASFAHNPRIYDPKGFADLGLESSWIDWLLRETETVHGESRAPFTLEINNTRRWTPDPVSSPSAKIRRYDR